jgi:signal transduction histidine kinase
LAHGFRSPLCSTISLARMMKNNRRITKQKLELFYDDIEQDATKMLESFDIILQWIRQQLSGYKFKAETLILWDSFLESAELFRLQVDVKRITVHNHIPEDMTVISNKEMLQFINRNLLSNAIKFSPVGGRIIVGSIREPNHNGRGRRPRTRR